MSRRIAVGAVLAVIAALPPLAVAHEFDHPAAGFEPQPLPDPTFRSGGPGAKWELLATMPTGNPHTDVDFFRHAGDLYAAVGTLAIGPNAGGQSIVRLTDGGEVDPSFVSSAPTASCLSNPSAALALQHDVEATPKGGTILSSDNPAADPGDAQVIVDATDQRGRCHDQGTLGLVNAPRGGLEIIDVTDPANPQTIGLTSHIGEAHTVNVDPKRPHIAYAVTSDSVGVNSSGERSNDSGTGLALDGFEVVDMSSCMNFAPGTSLEAKRAACRPEVYRYRWPSTAMAMGHTAKDAVAGCHELEVYADDRLTCAAIHATLLFDMSGAFDDQGTADHSDDKPRGTPLPCRERASTSAGIFFTGATVIDCVRGRDNVDLGVPGWKAIGSPSLEGVQHLGTAFHEGRSAGSTHNAREDIEVSHEAELTRSGRFLLVTDERGGGVSPPGATCVPEVDNPSGNGGIHAYDVSRLHQSSPASAAEAWTAYARTPDGEKAVYRAKVRSGAEPTVCTAHVFQQIPGQNRIFMAWYSQGTQVVDFVEHDDGSFEWREAGWFLPTNANEWVSHVFKTQKNRDGTWTYWGLAADFAVTGRGRDAIEVWKATLPAPPKPGRGGKGPKKK